jgi:uroporphyrinogen decarboxylase
MTETTAHTNMTSLQRVLTTLGQKEPDRVPFFLLVTMHGAKELGMSIKEYFSRAENVVEGQLRMRAKYRHDCLYSIFYAPVEVEAWGGEVIFYDDGPANSGEPFIRRPEEIKHLEPPRVKETPCLVRTLRATEMLKASVGDDAPIIGVVMSPFSLPVMQMGFDKYIELMYEQPDLFEHLMRVNQEFCVAWANAQLEAGATAIGYFDPVSSTTITPREMYLKTGFQVAKRTLARIKGPTATHMASGRCLPIIDDVAQTGTAIIGTSVLEDLAEVKAACQGKLTVLGNLNGIEMRRWTPEQAEAVVKAAIAKAGPGGGYILSDNHGEIPWQVPDEVLMALSEAVHQWGRYPLDWVEGYDA